jgi:hypothetical protein
VVVVSENRPHKKSDRFLGEAYPRAYAVPISDESIRLVA